MGVPRTEQCTFLSIILSSTADKFTECCQMKPCSSLIILPKHLIFPSSHNVVYLKTDHLISKGKVLLSIKSVPKNLT